MSEIAIINVILETSEGVKVSAGNLLELSLDCFICERTHRTILLNDDNETGICTPTKHLFPSKILNKKVIAESTFVEINYEVEYWFAPFIDKKYKETAKNILSWGRVNFYITCPKCGEQKKSSVQNNIVRPWTCYCNCGYALYFETEEYPKFEKINLN
jgi:hypothetical protein